LPLRWRIPHRVLPAVARADALGLNVRVKQQAVSVVADVTLILALAAEMMNP